MLCTKGALRNLEKFTGKHLCQRLFFNKESIGSLAYVFFCEFREISKSTFCAEHLQQLLLPFDIRQIQDFSSENRAIRSIQPQDPGPIIWLYTLSPLTPALRFSSVYQISATKHVAYWHFHCFSEDSYFEKSSMVEKSCVNFLFNFVSPTLSHFLITKNH